MRADTALGAACIVGALLGLAATVKAGPGLYTATGAGCALLAAYWLAIPLARWQYRRAEP